MAWVILGLGLALGASGAAAIWSGVSYMPVEWGWSQIIAGTTAISSGAIIIGLAAVVHRLRALQRAMPGVAVPVASSGLAPETDAAAQPIADMPGPESLERTRSAPSRPIVLTPAAADEMPDGADRHGRRVGIADVVGLETPEPDLANGVAAIAAPERTEGRADLAETAVDASPPSEAEERTVVGRYGAGGATYALFSDGTIEVETETGIHRFGSMDELKAFLEQQDRESQTDWRD